MPNTTTNKIHPFFHDEDPESIASSRSVPGILLINCELEVAYCNKEACDIINSLSSSNPLIEKSETNPNLPKKLMDTCEQFLLTLKTGKVSDPPLPTLIFESEDQSLYYSCRILPLGLGEEEATNPYLLVLIEKIVHKTNWEKTFKLSKREQEVIRLLLMGFTNKEIADKLFICTYTVEDHIKSIMRKLEVKNRLSLVLKVLNILS